jgi:hypothetical protein
MTTMDSSSMYSSSPSPSPTLGPIKNYFPFPDPLISSPTFALSLFLTKPYVPLPPGISEMEGGRSQDLSPIFFSSPA